MTVGSDSIIKNNVLKGWGSELTGFAIVAGARSTIIGNVATLAGTGIFSSESVVRDNVVSSNFNGIKCAKCAVTGNVVTNNRQFGLEDSSGVSGYANNQFDGNNGGNENPQVSGGIETGTNICGGNGTCP